LVQMGVCRVCLSLIGLFTVFVAVYVGTLLRSGPNTPVLCALLKVGCPEIRIGGFVAPGYEEVEKAFKKNFQDGWELGSQYTAFVRGQKVVDLWGEYGNTGYDDKSLQCVFSSTKALSGAVIAMAVDRGYFHYDDLVSKYWPEFAQNGKGHFTVNDVLRHYTGLSYPDGMEYFSGKLGDLEYIERLIVQTTPWYEGVDKKKCYHPYSRDLILSGLLRRTDPKKRTIGKFAKEELFDPLEIDYYVGSDPKGRRNLTMWPMPYQIVHHMLPAFFPGIFGITLPQEFMSFFAALQDNSTCVWRCLVNATERKAPIDPTWFQSPSSFVGESPGMNGVSNAGALATLGAMLVTGEWKGKRYISKEGLARAYANPVTDVEWMMLKNLTSVQAGWALDMTPSFTDGFYGWGGWGGSRFQWNPKKQIAVGYAMTSMDLSDISVDKRSDAITKVLVKAAAAAAGTGGESGAAPGFVARSPLERTSIDSIRKNVFEVSSILMKFTALAYVP